MVEIKESSKDSPAGIPLPMRVANSLDGLAHRIEAIARRVTSIFFGKGSGVGAGLGLGMLDHAIAAPLVFPCESLAAGLDKVFGDSISVRDLKDIVRTRIGGSLEDFCSRSPENAGFWQALNRLGASSKALDAGAADMDSEVQVDRVTAQIFLTDLRVLLMQETDSGE